MWDIRRSGATACLLCLNQDGPSDVPGRASLWNHEKPMKAASLQTAAEQTHRYRKRQKVAPKKERSDPHDAASVSLAKAHSAAINSLAYTPDGRFLLSSGHDHRLRVWNAKTGEHLFVHFQGIRNAQLPRSVHMAMLQEGDAEQGTVVWHPNGNSGEIACYAVHSSEDGAPLSQATAHYGPVTSCVYRKTRRQVWSGAEDGLIMKWQSPSAVLDPEATEAKETEEEQAQDQDQWSDDEEDESSTPFVPPILRQC